MRFGSLETLLKRLISNWQGNQKVFSLNKLSIEVPSDMAWTFSEGDYYESNVIYWIGRIIRRLRKPVLYDVGANYGYYSLRFSDRCKAVYSFEPFSGVFKILTANIKRNNLQNVMAFKIGLARIPSEKKLNVYSSSGNNSLFKRKIPKGHELKFLGKETIRLTSLDKFLKEKGFLVPNLIIIDVEGGELDVIKGAEDTIKKHEPYLIVEYSETTSHDAGYNRRDLAKALTGLNYQLHGLSSNAKDFNLYNLKSKNIGNLIAVPKGKKLT